MHLLQAMAGADKGGAEAFFERLAIALGEAGISQHLLIRRNPGRAARLRSAGLRVTELPFGGRLDALTPWMFRKICRSDRPTHILTWMNRATRFCPAGTGAVHLARLGGYYDLRYYRRCDHLIGNTPDLVQFFRTSGWPGERTHYLPNFANPPATGGLPDGLVKPVDRPLILALGRLHRNKAFDVLLKAVSAVPEAEVWLAGEGPEEVALRTQAASCQARVRFLGWQEQTGALLRAADVFVCPSRHEPLGNVILEAWAMGVPVVAAASEGPRQLITPEETGLLAPVDDADALGQALRRMLGDKSLRETCAAGGKMRYEQEFSREHVVAAYVRLFQNVAP